MIDIIIQVFTFLGVLGVLVFFHELGHFLAAKISGIRVIRFAIGFPPRLFGKKIGDTDYCLQLIPLGGYCKMAGMVDETLDEEGIKGEPWEFMSKTIPTRMFVLFAGPLANFLLAIFIFAVLANFTNVSTVPPTITSIIGSVSENSPAQDAGLLPGDKITAIDNIEVGLWSEMTKLISERPLETVTLNIERDNEIISKQVTFGKQDNPTDNIDGEVGVLGIGIDFQQIPSQYEWQYAGVFGSIESGVRRTVAITGLIAGTVKSLFTGQESLNALGGPVMIAQMTDTVRRRGIIDLLSFMSMLSISLGFMNLLPIPVLDGGHLMIFSIEGLARRQLPVKAKIVIQQIGLALLLVLMVVITYNDIMR